MNVERMRELADVVEASETYDQLGFYNDCWAPACIAGHAAWMWPSGAAASFDIAQRALGLNPDQAIRLFTSAPAFPDSDDYGRARRWPEDLALAWKDANRIKDDPTRRRAQAAIAAKYLRRLADEHEAGQA